MPPTSYRRQSDLDQPFDLRRAVSLLLAIFIHVLIILLLLHQTFVDMHPRQEDKGLMTFNVAGAKDSSEKSAKKEQKREREQERSPQEAEKREPLPKPEPKVEQPPSPLPFLEMDSTQMAAGNISRLPGRSAADASSGKSAGQAYGPGEGPGGVQLFDADWYRRPTHAELAGYVPASAPSSGWGLVACKTIENYHVDSCQVLGESPMGSGFGRAVRLAAWQFLVVPPRVDGKPQVGAWVRIRITYTATPL